MNVTVEVIVLPMGIAWKWWRKNGKRQ